MEKRVERKLRADGEIVAIQMPRHLLGVAIKGQYIHLAIEPNTRWRLCFQGTEQIVCLRPQLLTHTIYKINWQHTLFSQIKSTHKGTIFFVYTQEIEH